MKLEIRNINQFDEVVFNKNSNLEIIGGKNGSGKTTILEYLRRSIELSNTTYNVLAEMYVTKLINDVENDLYLFDDHELFKNSRIRKAFRNKTWNIRQTMIVYNEVVKKINKMIMDNISSNFYIYNDEYDTETEMYDKFKLRTYRKPEKLGEELDKIYNSNVKTFIMEELIDNPDLKYLFEYEDFEISVYEDEQIWYSSDVPKKNHTDPIYFRTTSAHEYWKKREYMKNKILLFEDDSENISETLEKISNEIPPIKMNENRSYFLNQGKPKKVNRIATGLNVFLFLEDIIKYKHLDQNTILLLDEPDAHLHPEWVVTLSDVLTDLVYKKNIKIIVATHNDFFINSLSYQFFLKKQDYPNFTKESDTISVLNLEFNEDGRVKGIESEINSPTDLVKLLESLSNPKLELLYDRMSID